MIIKFLHAHQDLNNSVNTFVRYYRDYIFLNVNIMFTFEFIDSIDKTVGEKSLEFHSKSEKKYTLWREKFWVTKAPSYDRTPSNY